MKTYIKPETEDLRLTCDADLMGDPTGVIVASGNTGGWG